jgi:hypothetical protein
LHKELIFVAICIAGCNSGTPGKPVPPPLVCKTPGAPQASFTDVTAEWGAQAVLGTSVRAGDLDGDGYPDLLTTIGNLAGRDSGTTRQHFLLMNRADPSDPSGKTRMLVDTTVESGLGATRDGVGGRGYSNASFGDLDNDGDLDVIVCPGATDMSVLDPCAAFLNDGTAHFQLAPQGELEGAGVFQSNSAALGDFDGDGVLDFWPGSFGGAPLLFHGNGDGTFHDIAADAGLPQVDGDPATGESFRRTFGVTACDLDGDGDLDVLLADYGREANQVWINDGASHFTEHGVELGVAYDDRMDFSDDQSWLCWCQANPGQCPAGTAMPVAGICPDRGWVPGQSDAPWRLGGNTFSLVCGDLDDDGDADLMSAEIRHGDVGADSDPSEILRNDTPAGAPLAKFVRPGNAATGLDRHEVGIDWNEGDMMPVFADVDLDGRKDIYLTSSDYPGDHGWLWRQKPDGTFEDVTAASGAGHKQIHGVALVDLDLDGDLDLVAGTSTARAVAPTNAVHVYRNDTAQDQNWTRIRLVGAGAPGGNRSAIGARVRVTAGGRTQTQEVSGGYGHNVIQNDLALTFGLGATCAIDRIEVRWPDAAHTVSSFTDVRANYRLELHEGSADVVYLP